jgi:hypothetical protein
MILGVALAVGLALLAGAILLEAWIHTRVERELTRKSVDPPVQELEDYRAEQAALMDDYRWIDRDAGVVSLPIERAMELVVEENGGSQR